MEVTRATQGKEAVGSHCVLGTVSPEMTSSGDGNGDGSQQCGCT
jgi:hypothetical protein